MQIEILPEGNEIIIKISANDKAGQPTQYLTFDDDAELRKDVSECLVASLFQDLGAILTRHAKRPGVTVSPVVRQITADAIGIGLAFADALRKVSESSREAA